MTILKNPIHILGIELRTTNDHGQSFHDIPPFWETFMKEQYMNKIPNKLSSDIYAVYTHFENEGKNNTGMYSLILGCTVQPDALAQQDLVKITIPQGNYLMFPVDDNNPNNVGKAWQKIWGIPQHEKQSWTFHCEFERYHPTGGIEIYIGTAN